MLSTSPVPVPGARAPSAKSRRPRACDYCREKKVQCDGPRMPNHRCSKCVTLRSECTYVGPPRMRFVADYTVMLETRIRLVQDLLIKHASKAELEHEFGSLFETDSSTNSTPLLDNSPSPASTPMLLHDTVPHALWEPAKLRDYLDRWCSWESESPSASSSSTRDYGLEFSQPSFPSDKLEHRFHGESSGVKLVQTAEEMRKQFSPVSHAPLPPCPILETSRWTEDRTDNGPSVALSRALPPPDLIPTLFENFFRFITPFYPVVHRPTFEAQYRDRLHERDSQYAQLLLMVCALASVYTNDARVQHQVRPGGRSVPGYGYYAEAEDRNSTFSQVAQLPTIQICVITALYHQCVGDSHTSWSHLGIGIRYAQDVGAHRKDLCQDEQWKRTFWCLVSLDRLISSVLGRTPLLRDDDIDLDLPKLLPDDEDEGRHITCFCHFLHLIMLYDAVMRTIYTVKPISFAGRDWEMKVVREISSALDRWFYAIPDYLRWEPARENVIHFEQSARIHYFYCYLVIMLHRPFSTAVLDHSGRVSSAIRSCTSAAKFCTKVLDAFVRRKLPLFTPEHFMIFASAAVLLTNAWARQKINEKDDVRDVISDVEICRYNLYITHTPRSRAHCFIKVLNKLAEFGGIALPVMNVELEAPLSSYFLETPKSSVCIDGAKSSSPIAKPEQKSIPRVQSEAKMMDAPKRCGPGPDPTIVYPSPYSTYEPPPPAYLDIVPTPSQTYPSQYHNMYNSHPHAQPLQNVRYDTTTYGSPAAASGQANNFLGLWSGTGNQASDWGDWAALLARVDSFAPHGDLPYPRQQIVNPLDRLAHEWTA